MWFLYLDDKLIAESDAPLELLKLIEALMCCSIVSSITLRQEKHF